MSSVELSDEVLARLRAEATRRGVTVETVIAVPWLICAPEADVIDPSCGIMP